MNWLESKYLYLGLMLFSILYPLAQSFEWRLKLYKKWRSIFKGIVLMSIIFIPWDIWFTKKGVWWFREDYITGFKLFDLPLEEWMFFLIVPYACVFIYEVLNFFIKKDVLKRIAPKIFLVMGLALLTLSILYRAKLYTGITFSVTGISCLYMAWRNPLWSGRFLLSYIVCWLPFLFVNGALTGNFTQNAIVNYNEAEIIGLRITTIPLEDSIYNLFMLLIVISVYERSKQ